MKQMNSETLWIVFILASCCAVQAAEFVDVANHAIKLHRGRGATITKGTLWIMENCKKLSGMLRQKNVVLNKLKKAIKAVGADSRLSTAEKIFQVHTFEIFQAELNESEKSVFQAVHGLERVLQGDYKDIVNMRESSKQRLEALREAAIKEEKEYVELLAAEKHQAEALKNMQHANRSLSILDEILEDVRKAADRLEEEIDDHVFDNNKLVRGGNVEAVIRVEEDQEDHKQNLSVHEVEGGLGLSMLIDSQNNQYILTKPRDSTIPRADIHFIKSIVQVETLGEFGVFFTLFVVGLEFSPDRLRKVWKISLQGTSYMTVLMVIFGLLWGHLLNIRPTQSIFISTCLSLSSTPLVSRFLALGARGDKEGDGDYSSVLLGTLVMQDVQLSLFIAVMPMLTQAGSSTSNSIILEILRIFALIGQILFSLAAILLISLVVKTYLIGPFYRKLHTEGKGNREKLVLGISAFIFLMLMATEMLDVSMELGCFLAGALISSQGHVATEEVMLCMEPIRDFLAIIFFTSIGLHVFPTFVLYELTVLMCLTLAVVVSKFILAVLVLSVILPRNSKYIRWIVSAGLAQVSEFSFVLSSRARKSGIVSREVYLLILSVTTLSLLLAPALWRAAILKCVPKPEKRLSS
ncbi:transmembrane and coiled-coil domain-containing protein 3 isoform X2 [Hemiscyllium ocellatum]|uniref:transmembrane and coiled-coil domain-containing protein 3 isoform X2 n=1 Tax=Hemiscyllium ocellatum TaxID=170820 RepID=UPI0029671727|nr:transmembrane and coiled-coil domain-containing protein 3 isoform X2 [Hemiscyllium ocellatum]